MQTDYKPPRYTDNELLEILPEAKQIVAQKIGEVRVLISKKENEIAGILNRIYQMEADEFSEWFAEEIVKAFVMPELANLEKELRCLRRFQVMTDPRESYEKDFQQKIESARNYPIVEIANSKLELRKYGRYYIGLCPFHNEKTPSFYIYPETNRFYCYGCQEKGDVITLTMALYGVDFKDAVKMLQN